MRVNTRQILIISFLAVITLLSGCSPTMVAPSGPEEDKRYVDICLDGKILQLDDNGKQMPVSNIRVILIDANDEIVTTCRTKESGRFLIESSNVAIGDYWDKHISVEIYDDNKRHGYSRDNRLDSRTVSKKITATPNNKAILTLDDIIMSRSTVQ